MSLMKIVSEDKCIKLVEENGTGEKLKYENSEKTASSTLKVSKMLLLIWSNHQQV